MKKNIDPKELLHFFIVLEGDKGNYYGIEVYDKIRYLGKYFYKGRHVVDEENLDSSRWAEALIPSNAKNIHSKYFAIRKWKAKEFAEEFLPDEWKSFIENKLKYIEDDIMVIGDFPEEVLLPNLIDLP